MKRVFLTLALAAFVALPNLASAADWKIDASHTSVGFKVRHLFTKVNGSFTQIEGAISFDAENPEKGSVVVTIPVSSVSTNNEKRDGHLMSPDFFDAENHPNITFKSSKFRNTDDGMKVDGKLTMRGVTKDVTLDVDFLGAGPGMMGGSVAGFSVSTEVDRKDFEINWNKALDKGGAVLGDKVSILIEIEAVSEEA